MSQINNIFSAYRVDPENVGDWWSPPHKYFNFSPTEIMDIKNIKTTSQPNTIIIGGGGLGREDFRIYLQNLRSKFISSKLIGWGIGTDLPDYDENRKNYLSGPDLIGDYFDDFDILKTRVWTPDNPSQWVPCSSACHQYFDIFYDNNSDYDILVYSHKRRKIQAKSYNNFWKKNRAFINIPKSVSMKHLDNSGNDLFAKLKLMSKARVILTNSYHGVYWGTLLGKKVICQPFKSGLFSFKHRPLYVNKDVTLDDLHAAPHYPGALDECRAANVNLFSELKKYLFI